MNHLEQLVAEWLQYSGYFVRTSVPVGPRDRGGYEGELDVVGIHLKWDHLIHVECSLDADSEIEREAKFGKKFGRGQKYIESVFDGIKLPKPEQVLVLQFSSGKIRKIGGARVVTVRDFVHEVYDGLKETSPGSKAVPSNLPLLRTLQLVADAAKGSSTEHRIIRPEIRARASLLAKSIDKSGKLG